ncbi:MAG: molecular chaperone HtpG [Candidatus Shikimatogenerans bostrichidophilus]|nr:MAG: molecular chaperone HtpG [Candidatus Shikimatogenerans bostrichidophilus]
MKIKGNLNIDIKKIFPIIKKFLYTNDDIFIRELLSNANDAILKLKNLINIKKLNINLNKFKIKININKKKKKIIIIDNGIGMTYNDVKKYINKIAFSGAKNFIKKYKNSKNDIIGYFGLGFYSSFLVSKKVEIISQSYKKNKKPIYWSCKGTTEFLMKKLNKKVDRGTKIILYINKKKFLSKNKIISLIKKYCNFLFIPIIFYDKKKKIINNKKPIWIKDKINTKESIDFYHYLFKNEINNPIFYIHLKIDYPFNLKGILYLPKIQNYINLKKNNIYIYQKQIFVTNNIKNIIPDFLILLKGIIDSNEIILNISRSNIRYNKNIIKIKNYIIRKVFNKIEYEIKNKKIEKKWQYVETLVIYGIISNDYFLKNNNKIMLYKLINNKYYTIDKIKNKIIKNKKQIDKNNKIIILYSTNYYNQYNYIKKAKEKGYKYIILSENPIFLHLIQKLESLDNDIRFFSVDSDYLNNFNILKKNNFLLIDDKKKEELKILIKKNIKFKYKKFNIYLENLSKKIEPIIINIPEYINRIKEINKFNNSNFKKNNLLENYNLIINLDNKIIKKIINENNNIKKEKMLKIILNFNFILKNLLKGKKLNNFINKLINFIF